MTVKKLFHYFWRYTLVTAAFLLLFLPNVIFCRSEYHSMEVYYLLTFGGLYPSKSFEVVSLIKFYSKPINCFCILRYHALRM